MTLFTFQNMSGVFTSVISIISIVGKFSWAGCSKLKIALVNISLKFQTLISNITPIFLLKKCEKLLQCKSFSHFFNKNIRVFSNKVVKHLTS